MRNLIYLLVLIACPFMANATLVVAPQGALYSTYDPIGGNTTVNTGDDAWSLLQDDSPLDFTDIKRWGLLTMGIDHHYPTTQTWATLSVTFNIRTATSYPYSGYTASSSVTLSIQYDPYGNPTFNDKQIQEYMDAVALSAEIQSITVDGVSSTVLPANVYIHTDIYADRIYDYSDYVDFDVKYTAGFEHLIDNDCDESADVFRVKWDKELYVEEYQLEWTFVNDYTEVQNVFKYENEIHYDFKYNSTRISTADDHFDISLIYDHGYLVYRVRGVGRIPADPTKRVYGAWTLADNGVVSDLDEKDFYWNESSWEYKKNWQYTASFAEEGKKKEVVSFFDGTLRNRQMVTVANTTDKAIVGETIYDFMGRPAIQVLPVPAINASCEPSSSGHGTLKFYNHFNENLANQSYTRKDFDVSESADGCTTAPTNAMSTNSGAARYYSENNSDQANAQAYLPNANGYPFSRVEYTPDNTGRIRRQGGVGTTFQLDRSESHESKYFYAHPNQLELDRLFGVEVGDATHYQKNMVMDPNGQVSVSYLDQEGRVIATALAGIPPANLVTLKSATEPQLISAELLVPTADGSSNSNELSTDGRSKTFTATVAVSSPTDITFHYTNSLPTFSPECMENVCFDCIYDLSFDFKDECGQSLVSEDYKNLVSGKFVRDHETGQIYFDASCTTGIVNNADVTFVIEDVAVGSYQVSKTLSINQAALDYYETQYMDPELNSCVKTLEDFQQEYLDAADFSGCNPSGDCEDCVAALGSQEDYVDKGYGTAEDYLALVAACRKPCQPVSLCDGYRQAMLMDMSPNGQYGEFLMPDGSFHTSSFPVSVYNEDNELPYSNTGSVKDWQYPHFITVTGIGSTTDAAKYYDEDLTTESQVQVQVISFDAYGLPNVCSPAVISPTTNVYLNTSTNTYYTFPQYLANTADFINAFKPSWAYSLLYYHPEYSYLRTCLEMTVTVSGSPISSEQFDQKMQACNTWEEAKTAGFIKSAWNTCPNVSSRLNDFGSNLSPIWDPFIYYASTYFGSANTEFITKLGDYAVIGGVHYSASQVAAAMARCGDPFGTTPGSSCFGFGNDAPNTFTCTNPISYSPADVAARDADWKEYRSLYYSIKQQYIQKLMTQRAVGNSAYYEYNACIGHPDFNPLDNGFFVPAAFLSSEYFDANQPCSVYSKSLYANKVRRFEPIVDGVTTSSTAAINALNDDLLNTGNYNQYVQTGECPVSINLGYLIDEVAGGGHLAAGSLALNPLDSYTGFMLSMQNPIVIAPLPNYNWVTSSSTSTQLDVNIVNASTSAVVGSIRFIQPATSPSPVAWSSVVGITNFHATTTGGLGYQFTANLKLIAGVDTVDYPVSGSTTYDIINCTFDNVCERNDLANDLFDLFNGIVAQGQFANTTGYTVQGGSAVLEPLVTDEILEAALGSPTSTETWVKSGLNFNLVTTAGVYLNFHLTNPTSFTGFSSIVSFSDFIVTGANTFILVGRNSSGVDFVQLEYSAALNNGVIKSNLPVGSCAPPTLDGCNDLEVQNLSEMQALLTDVLVNQNAPFNLYASNYMTSSLASQLVENPSVPATSAATITVYADGLTVSPRSFVDQTETVVGSTVTRITHEQEVTSTAVITYTVTETCTIINDEGDEADCSSSETSSSVARTSSLFTQSTIATGLNCPLVLTVPQGFNLDNVISVQSFSLTDPADEFGNHHAFDIAVTFTGGATSVIKGTFCLPMRACTEIANPYNGDGQMPIVPFVDPCTEMVTNLAYSNAQNAYNDYRDSLLGAFRAQYIAKCMSGIETLREDYRQNEHHFTLYYYDQAGNLVKTIPPEGVEPFSFTSADDLLYQSIEHDKLVGTQNITTEHRMATVYSYNSLNQLVAQHMPDMDDMSSSGQTLANGLDQNYVANALQMITESYGYSAGYVTSSSAPISNKRGYLYQTTDGGNNWSRVTGLLPDDLIKVRMLSSTIGFAIGKNGVVLKTVDGGNNWDLVDMHSLNVTGAFVDLAIKKTTAKAALLLSDGRIVKYNSGTFSLVSPSYTAIGTLPVAQSISIINADTSDDYLVAMQATDATTSEVFTQMCLVSIGTTISVTPENTVGKQWLSAQYLPSGAYGFVGGSDGDLLTMDETYTTQTLHSSNMTGSIFETVFFDKNNGVARINTGGSNYYLYRTTDGGDNWTQVNSTICNALTPVQVNSTSMYVAAAIGTDVICYYVTSSAITLKWTSNIGATAYTKISGYNDHSDLYIVGTTGLNIYKSAVFNTSTSGTGPAFSAYYTSFTTNTISVLRTKYVSNGSSNNWLHVLVVRNGLNNVVDVYQKQQTTPPAAVAAIISPASTVFSDIQPGGSGSPTTSYVLGYETSTNRLYNLPLTTAAPSGTMAALTNTTSLPATGNWVALGLRTNGSNENALMVGKDGVLYASSAINVSSTAVTWGDRSVVRLKPIKSIAAISFSSGTKNAVAVGDKGVYLTRNSSNKWEVIPLALTERLNSISAAIVGTAPLTTPFAYIAGENVTAVRVTLNTSATTPITTGTFFANFVDVNMDLVGGTGYAYMVASGGRSFFSNNINAISPSFTLGSGTGIPFTSVCIIPGTSVPPLAIAVASGGRVVKLNTTTQTEQFNIFGPGLNAVHFNTASSTFGTVGGDNYFAAGLSSGAWKTILPASPSSTILTKNIKSVWTIPTQDATPLHFALIGADSYLSGAKNFSAAASSISSGTVNDIQFNDQHPLGGYAAISGNLNNLTLTPSPTPGYTISTSTAIAGSTTINALYVFPDQDVIAVGNNMINFRPNGSSTYTNIKGSLSGNFKDVTFPDPLVGYVVGDAGKLYKTDVVTVSPTTSAITAASWIARSVTDTYIASAAGVNINAIVFPSLSHGVWAGNYVTTPTNPLYTGAIRVLTDETQRYSAKFYYDRLGRIVVSQNTRQLSENKYSYTLYDALGRVFEAGEKTENGTGVTHFADIFGTDVGGQYVTSVIDDTRLHDWIFGGVNASRKEVTRSYYDKTNTAIDGNGLSAFYSLDRTTQRKRIVHVTYEDVYDANDATYNHATHYEYDIHGNVKTLIQDNKTLGALPDLSSQRFKRMDYLYDLVSGNVHRVAYQTGKADQWHHSYTYDADNRIVEAFTTTSTPFLDGSTGTVGASLEATISPYWDQEADYTYYDHGPLARTLIGEQSVQGVDYVYTLQGWIKSVNSNDLSEVTDPGQDGSGTSINRLVAKDVASYSLHYFEGDYQSISGYNHFIADQSGSQLDDAANSSNLYNGNIRKMVTTITNPNTRAILPMGNAYQYDQLNRLKQSKSFTNFNFGSNAWGTTGSDQTYFNSFDYDANGNITGQIRKDDAGNRIDDLIYYYPSLSNGKKSRNRLYHVYDDPALTGNYTDDIDNMTGSFDNGVNINTANNYAYDAEGRLIKDNQSGISLITWRVDGKVKTINNVIEGGRSLKFDYDAMGHRIAKHVYSSDFDLLLYSDYYVLDAQGNVMSVYRRNIDAETSTITFEQTEKHIYGSSRVGIYNESLPLLGTQNAEYSQIVWTHTIGKRSYELQNHLGNVLSVISDKPLPHDDDSDGVIDWYLADIKQSTDYSPFGVQLSGRNFVKSGVKEYRRGFNGMEKDDEIKGEGNSYTTEFRQYDPRLGRWLTLDPLMMKYANQSSYVGFNNNPIYFADPTGLEGEPKQGDTRMEGDVQQVYTGSGEGEGWKATSEVVHFQASGGNGVFVRGGDAGSYNYQKIESVIISINGDFNLPDGYSEQLGDKNSWLISCGDIKVAEQIYREKFGDLTVGTMVIRSHGGQRWDRGYQKLIGAIVSLSSSTVDDPVTKYGISGARKGISDGLTETEYNDAKTLISLIRHVNAGGTLVLSACTAGGGDHQLLNEIGYAAPGINIFMNMDSSSPSMTKSPLGMVTAITITTAAEDYKLGWIKWGIINQEKVEKNGASPKYGVQILKTDTETGLMKFEY